MSANPDTAAIRRLSQICGMFGSQHDGERAAAAALADRMVRDLGLTWAEVIVTPDPVRRGPAPMERPRHCWQRPSTPQALAAALSAWPDLLTDCEARFCRDLAIRRTVTAKQLGILDRIEEKVAAYADAYGAARDGRR